MQLKVDCLNMELQHAERILTDLMGDSYHNINTPFILAVDSTEPGVEDYYERIQEPMWMTKSEIVCKHQY